LALASVAAERGSKHRVIFSAALCALEVSGSSCGFSLHWAVSIKQLGECVMRRFLATSIGSLLAIAFAGTNCWSAIYLFDGSVDNAFLTPNNWSDATPPPVPPAVVPVSAVPGAGDAAIINNNSVVTYGTGVATTLASLVVGADWPVTGDVGTAGTLNMSAGSFHITGGGSAFTIARACCAGDGIVNMTGNAALTIDGSDPQVGQRDHGELHIGPSASVTSPNGYWRLGNYGPSIDTGLQGNGLLDVQGTFSAMVIFIGDQDSDGELRVSGHGSVTLANNLAPRPAGESFAAGSSLVQMIGSTASLHAVSDESANGAADVHNKYKFTADAGGVSPITLSDAVNIDNNDLAVDLGSYLLTPGSPLTLFDAAPARIFGTFANVSVTGLHAAGAHVVYNQTLGDIQLAVPEPATILLMGIGTSMMAFVAKRRASR
jgi:PEP-CTERM motif